jgi:hypothetical protein
MKPTTIEQLAAVLAMIRPAKRYLIGKDWNTVLNEVWKKPESNEYFFKKSHATAYAVAIVVQIVACRIDRYILARGIGRDPLVAHRCANLYR